MTRNRKAAFVFLLSASLVFSSQLLLAQQSNLQTSFFAPASLRTASPSPAASITDSEHLPYASQIAKDLKEPVSEVHLNASDLLIQQAEERFREGRKFYRDRDYTQARRSFDSAIDAMLAASDNPTSRALYESKLEDMVDAIHRDDVAKMGAAAPETDTTAFDKAPLDDIIQMTFPVDPRIKTQVQTEVRSTVSSLPLVVNDAVLSYINYFNGRGRRTIEAGLEREGRYAPMISKILAEEGIPQELIHLAQAESGFLPRAVSRAAAMGMWQFVKFRGNQYGLMQTPYSDDRLDPEKATRAAAHHLHDLYNEFGDWYLAIAAYNCGPGAVERAVERTGYADFFELRARGALPNETTNYVPIILAMTIMAKNSQAYGLENIAPEPPVEYDTIRTSSPTNLALIGDLTDTSVAELLQMNPALLRSMAPADFEVRVPKGMGPQVTAALDLVPADRRASWRLHRVEAGETMISIARSFSLTSKQIQVANNLPEAEPSIGDQLLIPAAYHELAAPLRVPAKTAARTAGKRPATTTVASARKPAPRATTRTTARTTTTASAVRPAASQAAVVHHPSGVAIAQAKRTINP